MKTSHGIIIGVGALATAGILWAVTHQPKKARYAPIMMPRPDWHPPASVPGTPRHAMPGPPPVYPSHHGRHPTPAAPIPFHRASLAGGNNIFNKRVPANIKHQADNDPWDIGFPTPKTGVLGPWTGHGMCIGKEKRNNQQYYGSCSYC